jgi:hypothetical protein
MKSIATVAAGLVALSIALAGCGPDNKTTSDGPTNPAATVAPTAAPTTPTVKDLTPGNCTMYTKDSATQLIGPPNLTNNAIDINTDGGTAIDKCSYINLQGTQSVKGVSYAVVKFDSDTTAFTEAQKVQTEMLSDAGEHQWPVQTLTAPIPGAGQLLGGYGTKVDQGVTFTIAVVGTNVGPYLVVALGASTNDVAGAENYALSVFTSLAAAAS